MTFQLTQIFYSYAKCLAGSTPGALCIIDDRTIRKVSLKMLLSNVKAKKEFTVCLANKYTDKFGKQKWHVFVA